MKIASTAPAAPIRWPVSDLVAEIGICAARAPSALWKASASRASPTGVLVPCGLIMSISEASILPRCSAHLIERAAPAPPQSAGSCRARPQMSRSQRPRHKSLRRAP